MKPTSRELLMDPDDDHNRALVELVHPSSRVNPEPAGRYNLVVVGAGTAGLVSAVGAAGLGARVAIVERHLLGGDCLNYGCVPSKALVRAARAAADARRAGAFGVDAGPVSADFTAAMSRMRRLRAELAKNDSAERLTGLGIDVFFGQARFAAADAIDVDGRRLAFARAILATGARAAVPSIPGLAEAGYLTNETVFSLTTLPARVVVIGAGPIGCELAQALRRFGAEVTIVSAGATLLPRDDPDAAAIVRAVFAREGIRLVLDATIVRVERESGSETRRVVVECDGRQDVLLAEAVLVATGRAPNVEGVALERAGIAWDRDGVTVDDHLRTTNARVFAVGDIASAYKFTHAADALARIALQNALFFGRKAASALVIPWATYTDPEVAHVGLTAADAARRSDVVTLTLPFADLDRAVLDEARDGFARIHADARGRILGATVVGPHAGDMIGEMSLAMTAGVRMGTLARTVHSYPTHAEAWKKLGDMWNRRRLTPRMQSLFRAVMRWRR